MSDPSHAGPGTDPGRAGRAAGVVGIVRACCCAGAPRATRANAFAALLAIGCWGSRSPRRCSRPTERAGAAAPGRAGTHPRRRRPEQGRLGTTPATLEATRDACSPVSTQRRGAARPPRSGSRRWASSPAPPRAAARASPHHHRPRQARSPRRCCSTRCRSCATPAPRRSRSATCGSCRDTGSPTPTGGGPGRRRSARAPPYVIKAIGDSATMASAMDIPGGGRPTAARGGEARAAIDAGRRSPSQSPHRTPHPSLVTPDHVPRRSRHRPPHRLERSRMSELDYPEDLRYTAEHEWVRAGDDGMVADRDHLVRPGRARRRRLRQPAGRGRHGCRRRHLRRGRVDQVGQRPLRPARRRGDRP